MRQKTFFHLILKPPFSDYWKMLENCRCASLSNIFFSIYRLKALFINDNSAAFQLHQHYDTHFHMTNRWVHLHVLPWYKVFCSRERFAALFLKYISRYYPVLTPLSPAIEHRKGHEPQASAGEKTPSTHWDGHFLMKVCILWNVGQ